MYDDAMCVSTDDITIVHDDIAPDLYGVMCDLVCDLYFLLFLLQKPALQPNC